MDPHKHPPNVTQAPTPYFKTHIPQMLSPLLQQTYPVFLKFLNLLKPKFRPPSVITISPTKLGTPQMDSQPLNPNKSSVHYPNLEDIPKPPLSTLPNLWQIFEVPSQVNVKAF